MTKKKPLMYEMRGEKVGKEWKIENHIKVKREDSEKMYALYNALILAIKFVEKQYLEPSGKFKKSKPENYIG